MSKQEHALCVIRIMAFLGLCAHTASLRKTLFGGRRGCSGALLCMETCCIGAVRGYHVSCGYTRVHTQESMTLTLKESCSGCLLRRSKQELVSHIQRLVSSTIRSRCWAEVLATALQLEMSGSTPQSPLSSFSIRTVSSMCSFRHSCSC